MMASAAMAAETTDGAPATPTSSTSFFNSALGYFTSFNTNLDSTFGLSKGEAWAGVDALQGAQVPLANDIGVSYKIYKHVGAEAVMRNGGVTGTIISQAVGLNLNFVVHDAELTLYADGVYNIAEPVVDRMVCEIGVRVKKALTEHTFAGVGIGAQFPGNRQVFQAFAGFTF